MAEPGLSLRLASHPDPEVGDILAALSRALDRVEGQPPGHAIRTARIAVRIADNLRLSHPQIENAFYASLLKDSGCSNNSARIHKIFGGDEILTKRDVKIVDWSNPIASTVYGVTHAERGAPLRVRLRKIAEMARKPTGVMDEVTAARCSRGAEITAFLGFDQEAVEGVRCLDEHWDGRGSPEKLQGEAIPLIARIIGLAQTLEVFVTTFGVAAGYRMVRVRYRKWFCPAVADAALGFERDVEFWADHAAHLAGEPVPLPVPAAALRRPITNVDKVCEAFARVIDAKSSFTFHHSSRVAAYAVAVGRALGFDEERLRTLRRAGLLHDIGKLGVSNAILDKPGKLTDEEFAAIRRHPQLTEEVLAAIRGFERVTEIAAAHHERLDGKGYHRGLGAEQLDLDMRVLAAADVFDALSAERPYRGALPTQEVLAIMERDAGQALDPQCIDAFRQLYGHLEYVEAA